MFTKHARRLSPILLAASLLLLPAAAQAGWLDLSPAGAARSVRAGQPAGVLANLWRAVIAFWEKSGPSIDPHGGGTGTGTTPGTTTDSGGSIDPSGGTTSNEGVSIDPHGGS
jgi:hypothetical protein